MKKGWNEVEEYHVPPVLNDEKQSLYPRWCFQRHFDGDPFLLLTTTALTRSFSLRFTIGALSFRLEHSYIALVRARFSIRLSLSVSRSCNYGALTRVNH